MVGRTISHYRILEKLGEGGMGAVYKARDSRLDRFVALKVLPPEYIADPDRKRRFVQEARAASALVHPNIVTIHDIEAVDGVDFIAMELIDGQPLDRVIASRRLPLKDVLSYAVQIASALARTHAAGILHRDLKPSNIMVADQGLIKILDFGLAKLVDLIPGDAESTRTMAAATEPGIVLGTVAYMSPEQAEGLPVDQRSDIFSFGSLLYEMIAGRPAFSGSSNISTLSSILREDPAPLKTARADAPAALDLIVRKCLQKDRNHRYASAADLHNELMACQARWTAPALGLRAVWRDRRFVVGALAASTLLFAALASVAVRGYRSHWARAVALPEIIRLADNDRDIAAFRLARKVDRYSANEPELQRLRREIWPSYSINTEPPGADVFIRDYAADRSDWEPVGQSPLEDLRLPPGEYCVKLVKAGFEEVEGTLDQFARQFRRSLSPMGKAPPGMVLVPMTSYPIPSVGPVNAGPFWIDKYEVTNRQYKEFLDRGGYRRREYWKHPFNENGRTYSWEEAMARFVDSTGQPGPDAWELGSYPDGHADFPVAGVSWYEAAAYAEFAGKSLPTAYHWAAAAYSPNFATILQLSNFRGEGPVRVGAYAGVGRFGTYDMAGNVAEWCWNPFSSGQRCFRGGAWSDPNYMYMDVDAASPFARAPTRGFRCVSYIKPLPESMTGRVDLRPTHDFSNDRPADDDLFRVYKSIYSYDQADLAAKTEAVDDSSSWWRKERVSFNAAYLNERVVAFVFLPRNVAPPYQTVLYFPGSAALRERNSQNLEIARLDFVIRSGRAVVYPIYKGTYERRLASAAVGPNAERDLAIAWTKDLRRSIDYVESRVDLDRGNVAFLGVSLGAEVGPIFAAVEPRIKTSILQSGGLYKASFLQVSALAGERADVPAEANSIHYLPRVKGPVLMLNGRDDSIFPMERNQVPMFRLLGLPEKEKRHAVFACGHVLPRAETIREILSWLDRRLGTVRRMQP